MKNPKKKKISMRCKVRLNGRFGRSLTFNSFVSFAEFTALKARGWLDMEQTPPRLRPIKV